MPCCLSTLASVIGTFAFAGADILDNRLYFQEDKVSVQVGTRNIGKGEKYFHYKYVNLQVKLTSLNTKDTNSQLQTVKRASKLNQHMWAENNTSQLNCGRRQHGTEVSITLLIQSPLVQISTLTTVLLKWIFKQSTKRGAAWSSERQLIKTNKNLS